MQPVKVAIIDNGFEYHEDLWKNVVATYDVADNDENVTVRRKDDACAHGNIDAWLVGAVSTNQIGIISSGRSPKLILIKATPDHEACTNITAGIEWISKAIDMDADIISISWGIDYDAVALSRMIKKALKKGIVVVAAAGNFDTNKPFYPAAYDGVIAVWAVDVDNKKAPFSNYGPWVDISAPGMNMISTALSNKYSEANGTSQSAPVVAWWLAFLMAHGESPDVLRSHVTRLSTDVMGKWVINTRRYCQVGCDSSYSSIDLTDDGRIDELDILFLRDWLQTDYKQNNCLENYRSHLCCPSWKICDINGDDKFNKDDLRMFMEISKWVPYEVCNDDVDNDCDGVVDCIDKTHYAADVSIQSTVKDLLSFKIIWYLILLIILYRILLIVSRWINDW